MTISRTFSAFEFFFLNGSLKSTYNNRLFAYRKNNTYALTYNHTKSQISNNTCNTESIKLIQTTKYNKYKQQNTINTNNKAM